MGWVRFILSYSPAAPVHWIQLSIPVLDSKYLSSAICLFKKSSNSSSCLADSDILFETVVPLILRKEIFIKTGPYRVKNCYQFEKPWSKILRRTKSPSNSCNIGNYFPPFSIGLSAVEVLVFSSMTTTHLQHCHVLPQTWPVLFLRSIFSIQVAALLLVFNKTFAYNSRYKMYFVFFAKCNHVYGIIISGKSVLSAEQNNP